MKAAISATCALVLSAGISAAGTLGDYFDGYFALGDSLSDPGNLYAASGDAFPPAPYVDGHFSNGPTFTEYLAAGFDPARVRNYAYGFAEAINPGAEPLPAALALHLDEQLSLFLNDAAGGGAAGSLVTLWFGANDIFEELDVIAGAPPANPFPQLFNTASAAALAVASAVSMIVDTGPAQVVVLNLPDLGVTPGYSGTPLAPLASYAAGVFNAAIAGVAGPDVSVFDIAALFSSAQANPAAYGLDPALAATACFEAGAAPDCTGYLFADLAHPTTAAHEQIASAVADSFKDTAPAPVPLPASLPLLLGGLGVLALARRRRAA